MAPTVRLRRIPTVQRCEGRSLELELGKEPCDLTQTPHPPPRRCINCGSAIDDPYAQFCGVCGSEEIQQYKRETGRLFVCFTRGWGWRANKTLCNSCARSFAPLSLSLSIYLSIYLPRHPRSSRLPSSYARRFALSLCPSRLVPPSTHPALEGTWERVKLDLKSGRWVVLSKGGGGKKAAGKAAGAAGGYGSLDTPRRSSPTRRSR